MSDASHVARSLRERLGTTTEDRLGRALSELLENPVLTGAIGRAFDAREKAAQAQEVAMGALNIPSAADIERLTRRLRSVSQRLEGIEDGVERLDRALGPAGSDRSEIAQRLSAIEAQLRQVTERLDHAVAPPREGKVSTAQTRAGNAKTKTKAKPRTKPAAKARARPGKA
jgi:chromosome segregation ATPase